VSGDRFNVDMLRLARDAREFTQADLAEATGVTQALISKIENGLIQHPSDDVVEKICAALKFPRAFFFQQERQIGFPPFHYRKRQKLGVKPIAHIGAIINIRRQHIAKLLRSYDFRALKPIPQIDLDESGLTPERVAERLRAYWMLPRGPISSVVETIEDAGGIVVLARFGTDLLDGISFRSEGLPPLFFMNREMPGDRFRFSLAHELGHMVMHTIPADDQKMEQEAHRFAAAFLMPSPDIRPYLKEVKLSSLGRVKGFWKVSIKALIKRAHDLKLITDNYYRILNINYNKSFPDGEPIEIAIEQPAKMKEIVQFHREKLGYTVRDLASLLCLQEDDMRRAYLDKPRLELVVSN
jgi:Zn-dependent peptidase ImmA (M78 family)/transcriptional regulator with XRE-family HTH domain